MSGTYDDSTPAEGESDWATAVNEGFAQVEADVRALAERLDELESSGGPAGVPVADRPANGFWPHGWYYGEEQNEPAEVAANVGPIVDALGAPRIVGNTVGKGQNGWSFLAGGWDTVVTRTKPTGATPWDHTWVHHPLIPYGDEDDPAPDTVRGADGADLIEKREAILGRAADGEFDDRYRGFARVLAENDMADRTVVRLAPEFNGIGSGQGWQPAAAVDNEGLYREAFRRFAEAVWSVAPETLIGFSPSITHSKAITERAWPGAEYVDYLAVSGIHDRGYGTGYAREEAITGEACNFPDCSESANQQIADHAWEYYRTEEFGLDAAASFAAEHDLPIGFPEWGLDTNRGHSALGRDNPYFLRRFYDWMVGHNVHWQTYFEARGYDGAFLAGPEFPDALAAYDETFSRGTDADPIARYRETIAFDDRPT